MNVQDKEKLAGLAVEWLAQSTENTQSDLARRTGLSVTNINHIARQQWKDKVIGDAQWRKLQVFFKTASHINSANYLNITNACQVAHEEGRIIGLDGYTGAGKSYALESYWKGHSNVFLVRARRSMGGKTFMREVAKQVGANVTSGQLYDVENSVIQRIKAIQGPVLLILDEIEYLKPLALDSVKVLLQELDAHCGIVICGIIKQWLERLSARNVQGMPQFLRRVGHSWLTMAPITAQEIRQFAKDNGITDRVVLDCLVRDCKDYDALQKYVRDLVELTEAGGPVSAEMYNHVFHAA